MSGLFNSLKSLASGSGGARRGGEDTRMRFSAMPHPGDSGFTQWHDAMKMVARLPGGIPPEFRRRLWLTLAEKHLQSRSVDWSHAERFCFNEWMNPDDDELGIQIVKDLHRTGCSLFCGVAAQQNQALLKRVLLAFARWNKAVGYCQGFNMLAAIILQVCDRSDTDALKVMIYLIEGVLPESYFANNLRGLSVDMAVFRDLLRLRLPSLSRHLEQLQHDARDTVTGTSYEPPLTNVFTMQWFLTLFSNCLPQSTVLRVWDLIFLEGNEVLLRTALAIWDTLADRIMAVDSADEFYSIMGVLTREMLEFGLMDTNNLIKAVVRLSLPELPDLRDKYLYNITPWSHTVSNAARRGLRLFHSDDEEETDEDDEKMAVAAAYGLFRSPRQRDSAHRDSLTSFPFAPDRERLALDISALKQQYSKLRERQRQAHIILTAACARQPLSNPSTGQVAMNHLLLGKSALMSVRGRRGAPPGAVPPPAIKAAKGRKEVKLPAVKQTGKLVVPITEPTTSTKAAGETLHWKDASLARKRLRRLSLAGESVMASPAPPPEAATSPVAEEEQPEEATLPPDDQDVDDDDGSSTSTELCDEPDRLSDFDSEEPTSVSEASSYNLAAATDDKARGSPPPLNLVTTISPVYEEEGPSCNSLDPAETKDLASPLSELGSSFDLKVAGGGEKCNKSLSPSSGETSSYNLASSKTTSFSRSEMASPQVDGEERRVAGLARNSTETSLMRLDDDYVIGVERSGLARNSTETSLTKLDDDDEVNDDSDAPPPDTGGENAEAKNETDEIDLMQIEDDDDVEEDDLDASFENFVVERRKSTTTPPVELDVDDDAGETTEEFTDQVVEKVVPVANDEAVKEDRDILKELVSQLSLDLTSISLPSSSSQTIEVKSELPKFVCELVDEVGTTFHTPLDVLPSEGEISVDAMPEESKQVDVSSECLSETETQDGDRRDESKTEVTVEVVLDDTQVNYLRETAKKESGDTKSTGVVEYLDVGPKFNVGRRHSERAMQIIHENNLILQNISQLQARRPSDLSGGGDVTKRRSTIGLEIPEDESPDVLQPMTSQDDLLNHDSTQRTVNVSLDPILRTVDDLLEDELKLKTSSDDVVESTVDVVVDDVSSNGLTVDDLLECELNLESTDDLDSWPSKCTVEVFVEQVSKESAEADVFVSKPSEEGDVVNREHTNVTASPSVEFVNLPVERKGDILNRDTNVTASPSVEFVKLPVESKIVKAVTDGNELCAGSDFKRLVFPADDTSASYLKGRLVNDELEAAPSENARASFQRAGVGPRTFARSVDLLTDAELLSVVSERVDRNVDRNVSLSSTDLQCAKRVVVREEEDVVVVGSPRSSSDDSHAYKPYYFNDGSKRRSISLDETDSSKYNKETDRNNENLCTKPERPKIFLPLRLCSSKSRGGLESSKLSPILSKSTEVLSPVGAARVSDVVLGGAGMSKSHDDLSPVTFRFKSFPIGNRTPTRGDSSPGQGAGEVGGRSTTSGAKSQRYSWACYENDKIFASGDAKMSPMSSPMSRTDTSRVFRPPYGVATRSSDDGYDNVTGGGSGEWTFEMTKTALKMKRIFSPLTTTPDEAAGAMSPLHPSYVFPTPPSVARTSDGGRLDVDASTCDRKPLSQAAGDALTDYNLPDDPTYSRLDTTYNPKEYSSQASFEKISFEPSASRYSPYKFPKTDLETLGLEVDDDESNPSPLSDLPAYRPSATKPPTTLENDVTSPRHAVSTFPAFPKSPLKSPTKTFDPFPTRGSVRAKPKEVAVKLGLYANSSTAGENKTKLEPDSS